MTHCFRNTQTTRKLFAQLEPMEKEAQLAKYRDHRRAYISKLSPAQLAHYKQVRRKNQAKWRASRTAEQKKEMNAKAALCMRQPSAMWNQYHRSAAQVGREFALTRDDFDKLIHLPCHYCYVAPDPTNGIDRYDNDLGYIASNCVPCCWMCNHAKGSTPIEEFLPWLARIAAAHGN